MGARDRTGLSQVEKDNLPRDESKIRTRRLRSFVFDERLQFAEALKGTESLSRKPQICR